MCPLKNVSWLASHVTCRCKPREAREFGSSFWQKQEGIVARKRPTNDCNSTLTRGPGFPRVHHSTVIPPGEREKHHLHKNNKTTFPQTEAQVSVSVSLSLSPLTFLIPLSFFFPLTPPGQPPPQTPLSVPLPHHTFSSYFSVSCSHKASTEEPTYFPVTERGEHSDFFTIYACTSLQRAKINLNLYPGNEATL